MWEKIETYRKENQMFTANDVVIAGVSGGADSMCLLCVLDIWRKRLGFQLVVVHVNHGLRGAAADEEEAYVQRVCEEREIPFEACHIDVKWLAEKEKISEEEAGRNARRRAFEEVAEKYRGTKIALAHHKNDNAETFLFHLARGSRLKGLGGMHPVNGKYVRPLLAVSREEIEAYLQMEGIQYYQDASNATDQYTRNRIRNHVLPYLCEHVNGQAVEHIDQTMKYLREVQEYLESQMAILWKDTIQSVVGGVCVKNEIMEAPALVRNMVLHRALTEVAGKEKDILEVHVETVESLFSKQSGRRIDLPYRLIAVRTYQGIEIKQKRQQEEELSERKIPLQNTEFVWENYQIQVRIFEKPEDSMVLPKKVYTKWFDYDILNESVCIRGRKTGDRIVIDKAGNSQKLKQYFINEKIPADIRSQIPIISEGANVLWVVGYRQSKAYQVTEQTKKILEIKINGGSQDGRED